ncbi:hypothetical protein Aduo_005779 [Ancylostoma duodenale]
MYIHHFGLSDEEIARMEQLMTVIDGMNPPISYKVHVANLNRTTLQQYNRQRYYFCCACSEGMTENQLACENRSCSIYGLNIKRAKRMQRVEVHVMNVIPQLSEVLARDIEKIIASHQSLHEHRANKYFNSIIAGAIFSRIKPTERMVETLISRLESELCDLRDAPLEIMVNGVLWTVQVKLFCDVADRPSKLYLYTARVIYERKRSDTFNLASYEEFVHSESANRVTSYLCDGLINLNDVVLEMRLNITSTRLMHEIHCAKLERLRRIQEISWPGQLPRTRPKICLRNLTRSWTLDGPEPFAKVALERVMLDYHSREKDTSFQKFASMYRYLLQRITEPPSEIRQYSLRINGRSGRNEALKSLPPNIKRVLLDFGEDIIGFGHDELKGGVVVNPQQSGFFIRLGETTE